MRKTLRASVLMLALCSPASAGIILCPSAPAPPPDGVQAEQTTDGFTETILSVLESVLALF